MQLRKVKSLAQCSELKKKKKEWIYTLNSQPGEYSSLEREGKKCRWQKGLGQVMLGGSGFLQEMISRAVEPLFFFLFAVLVHARTKENCLKGETTDTSAPQSL
jgi:hypothetical protein